MTVISLSFFAATEIVVHYHRYDNSYEGWNLWVWGEGANGKAYEFTADDEYGKTARINIPDDFSRAGVIVRLREWEDKDVAEDRYINIEDGKAEIFLLQGVKEVYLYEPDVTPRIFFAGAVSRNQINAYMTNAFDTKDWHGKVSVYADEVEKQVEVVEKVVQTDLSITNFIKIKLEEPLTDEEITGKVEVMIEGFSPSTVIMMGILDEFYYEGDLGAIYSEDETVFRVWSPVSKFVNLKLYENWDDENPYMVTEMKRIESGVWESTVYGDMEGKYYLYEYDSYGEKKTGVDPYSKAVAKNSLKSAIIDLKKTNPENWELDEGIDFGEPEDAIIYEVHIADLTGLENSGVEKKATYLGMVELGTKGPGDVTTGLDHITELGVTHVHILPMFDFYTGDEANRDFEDYYNWGYDPYLFMCPEGRYSSDPFTPETRINEAKRMVGGFHENGINVIMDVVFPHTYGVGELSAFDLAVPYYYYKIAKSGAHVNESGCGNTMASHRPMMRKFITDAVKYWVEEYHFDGFRFDQMGFMDFETMMKIDEELSAIKPYILLYGEGWGDPVAADYWGYPDGEEKGFNLVNRLVKAAVIGTDIGAFNDDIRDAIRGSVFDVVTKGFVMDSLSKVKKIKSGLTGSIDFSKTEKGFTDDPAQSINYAACHDNHTLWDKNRLAASLDSNFPWDDEMLINAQKLAGAILMTSQGVAFLHGGQDFCRTKYFDGNSYNSPISVNGFDYSRKAEFIDVFNYYKGLIELRKNLSAFRLKTDDEIRNRLEILGNKNRKVVSFVIDAPQEDPYDQILVVYNGNNESAETEIPQGKWNVIADSEKAGIDTLYSIDGGIIRIPATSAFVMVR